MSEMIQIQPEQFTRRLIELCLRSNLTGVPKKEIDQQILLKSAVLLIGTKDALSEKKINEKLEVWVSDICQIQNYDRVSLRRWLVDSGYVTRSRDGAVYQVAQPGPGNFAAEIDQLDVVAVIAAAREEIAWRKQEYMQKSKDG